MWRQLLARFNTLLYVSVMSKKKKKIEEQKPEYKVYLDYSEHRSGGEPDDPDDCWTSHEDEYVDFSPVAIMDREIPGRLFAETIPVDFEPKVGDDVTLVVVRYDTGSTFGRVCNVWQIIGVFKEHSRALEAQKLIEDYSSKVSRWGDEKPALSYDDWIAKLNAMLPQDIYPSWFGYFETYNYTQIFPMRIRS